MSLGKTMRLKRLIEPQYGTCNICALDHGMSHSERQQNDDNRKLSN